MSVYGRGANQGDAACQGQLVTPEADTKGHLLTTGDATFILVVAPLLAMHR
jgi:hypothetical protein